MIVLYKKVMCHLFLIQYTLVNWSPGEVERPLYSTFFLHFLNFLRLFKPKNLRNRAYDSEKKEEKNQISRNLISRMSHFDVFRGI